MRRNSKWASVCAAAAAVVAGSFTRSASAATVYWQGGNAAITDSNYTLDGPLVIDANDNLAAGAADLVRFGATGTGTLNGASATFGTLWVGHNEAVNPSTTNLSTVTVSNGATLSLAAGASGSANAGLIVGQTRGGILNIDGATTSVTSNQLVVIGFASNQPGRNGTINITNGATLNVTAGNINMGDSSSGGQNGIQGHMNVDGNVNVLGGGADINLGIRKSTCTVTQTGGLIQVADQIQVGFDGDGTNPGSPNSTYTITGGTTTTGVSSTGNFWVGRATSTGATFNLSGTGTLNVGNRFIMGSDTATGVKAVHSAGTLNVDLDLRIADSFSSATSDATYNLSGTGVINALGTAKTIVGRRGIGKFLQTGGTATLGGTLSIGDQESATVVTAADGLYSISAGTLTATGLSIGTDGKGEFRVIGDDGTIDINGAFANGNTADGLGTLAFNLEAGDLGLSQVDVSGAATFSLGAALKLDFGSETTSQTSFNLLTATTITDNGLAFSGPAGWQYEIIAGGNGQVLRAFLPTVGGTLYWDIDGATAGSGGATPSGNWDGAAANFTSASAGDSGTTTAATTANDDVVFAAGTDSTGAYTVTVSGTQSAKSVQVARGSVSFTGGTIATPTIDVAPGASAAVSSALSGDPTTFSVTKTGAGTLTVSSANTYGGGTTVAGGTLVLANADATAGGAVNVADGAVVQAQAGLTKAVTVSTLNTNTSGKFDVTNNSMVVKGMTDAQVRTQLQAGYNGGAWNGANGITSSAVNSSTSVGYASNTSLGLTEFKGVSGLAGSDVIVKYTYAGDANLDGKVDIGDLGLLAGAWQQLTGKVWFDGDFTYDGAVNIGDLGLLAGNWQKGTVGNPSGPLMDFNTAMAQFAAFDGVVVPEPASLSLLALGAVGVLGRRRRQTA